MRACALAEFGEVQVRVLDVPAHGEIGTIDLQHQSGRGDGFIFVPHRVGDGEEIIVLARVVLVAEEQ